MKQIMLNGHIVKVDNKNADRKFILKWNWQPTSKGYLQATIYGESTLLHRLIYELEYGDIPDGYDIHHLDNDKTNNVLSNLKMIDHTLHGYLSDSQALDAIKTPPLWVGTFLANA